MSIGNQIKRLREKNNMNQEQFAKYIGVSASTIGMYEQGRRKPKYEILEAIADIFNIPMSYLFEEDNNQVLNNTKILDYKENELLKYFEKLNELGKDRVIETAQDLSKLEKYTENTESKKKNA